MPHKLSNLWPQIASYDALSRYRDATSLLHYLMAFKPSSPSNATLVVREEADSDSSEFCCVRAACYGLDRADGGCVLLTCWTEPADQPMHVVGEAVLFAGYVLDMPDGGEAYYASPLGRAMREVVRLVRAETRRACGLERGA